MGKVFTPAQAAPSLLLAYAAIRVQRAASKEAMLHHAMGQEKDKRCQDKDEEELQESTQTHSPLIWVHRIPGRSHTNRLSGHRLQVAVQSALPLYIVRRRDRRVDSTIPSASAREFIYRSVPARRMPSRCNTCSPISHSLNIWMYAHAKKGRGLCNLRYIGSNPQKAK